MHYPVRIEPDGSTWMVSCRDIPKLNTCGDTVEEARANALDALLTAFEIYFDEWLPIPLPTPPQEGEVLISVTPSKWAKVLLLNTVLEQRLTLSEAGRRAGVTRQEMTRIRSMLHNSTIEQVDRVMSALGKRLVVTVEDAA